MKEFEIKLNDCDPWPEERCTKIPFLCPKCKEPDVWFEESGFWCQNCGLTLEWKIGDAVYVEGLSYSPTSVIRDLEE